MTQSQAVDDDDWYGLGTELLVHDGEPLVGHTGSIRTYHGVLRVALDTDAAIAVLVPAPARNTAEVSTDDLPLHLLEALTDT